MQRKLFNSSLGFSVIDLLVSLFILSLIGVAIWTFQKDVFSLNNVISSTITAQEDVRRVFKTITAEIRSASSSNIGAYPIDSATLTSFVFYSDIDGDRIKERIRYFLNGTILKKGVLKPTGNPLVYNPAAEIIREVVYDVANGATPIFSYYDTNYDGFTPPLTSPIDVLAIRLIKITVIVDHDSSKPPSPVIFTTQASIRNLKDNL